MVHRALIVSLLAVAGCTRVEYLDYRGVQSWPTGSAFVHEVDGIDVYEGLPDRPYEVIGMIDVWDDKPFFHDKMAKDKVFELYGKHGADALVWLSDRAVTSGSFRMEGAQREAAQVDTGRSSQPEMIVSHVGQYVASSYKKTLRSSLLLVRWQRQAPAKQIPASQPAGNG